MNNHQKKPVAFSKNMIEYTTIIYPQPAETWITENQTAGTARVYSNQCKKDF